MRGGSRHLMDPNGSRDLRWLPRPPGVSTVAIVMDLSLSGFPSRTAASAGTVALGGAEVSAAAGAIRWAVAAMMSLGSLRRGRSALSPRERLGTANRVRRVFGDASGLRGPQSVRRGATAMMYLNVLRRGRSALSLPERLGDREPRTKGVRG